MATSIKLFQFFQKINRFIGIFPSQWNQKYLTIHSLRAIFVICCAQWIFPLAAFSAFEAKSTLEYGLSFSMILCALNGLIVYLVFAYESQATLKFIERCETFMEKRLDSLAAYNETMGKIERMNRFIALALTISTMVVFYSATLHSFVQYYVLNMGQDSFYFFTPAWYPFDWKTPSGYLVASLSQWLGPTPPAFVTTQFLSLIFGACWLFMFIAEDIKQDVAGFNFIVTTAKNENRTELTKRFRDLMLIYIDAKACVKEFNHTMEYSLFVFFGFDLFFLASSLVTIQFQLWTDDSNLVEMVPLICVFNWSIVILLTLCEPGARVTNQFEGFSDEVGRCDWHTLPNKMQSIYMIFLSDTQNPVKVSSFAGITCERETSKRILRKAYSFFMAFRRSGA